MSSPYNESPALYCLIILATRSEFGVLLVFNDTLDFLFWTMCAVEGSRESILEMYLRRNQEFAWRESTGRWRSPVLHQEHLKSSLWGQRWFSQCFLESLHQTFSCSVDSWMVRCSYQIHGPTSFAPVLKLFRKKCRCIIRNQRLRVIRSERNPPPVYLEWL